MTKQRTVGRACPGGLGLAAAGLAVSTMLAGCASSGSTAHVPVPRPFPTPGAADTKQDEVPEAPAPVSVYGPLAPPPAPKSLDSYALVGTALGLRGAPYVNGGASPRGFDCSGFTQYVFAQYGVGLPRAVQDQFKIGRTVKPTDLSAGDLLFFTTTDRGASHVGIAVGGDEFVHAPTSTGVVRVERLSATYWSRRFIGARRVR